jgi:hypothetical protein
MHTYEEMIRYVPQTDRCAVHARAIDALDGADLLGAIEVLTRTAEFGRLAGLVEESPRTRLQGVSHTTLEPAAVALTSPYPSAAAKLRVALSLRIVEAKKSAYYRQALAHLELARDLLVGLGREVEWRSLVSEIHAAHHRKSAFMPGLQRLAAGWRSAAQPSFMERARQRWDARLAGRTEDA